MAKIVATRGLALRTVAFSDSSQIVTVFTKDMGIISVLAKGAMRPARRSSSFPAPFDLAGWYDLVVRLGRSEVHLASEARLVEGFRGLRESLPRYLDACVALDVMPYMFSPGDSHPEFLRGTLSYLKLLSLGQGRRALRIHYHGLLLREGGLAPEWLRCSECGGSAAGGGAGLRLPLGVVCRGCRQSDDVSAPEPALQYLAAEAGAPWDRVRGLDPGAEVLAGSWRILKRAVLYHLERPIRSLRYLRD